MARPSSRSAASPRMSVNDLGLFMVSSDTARMGIIRRAREPRAHTVTRYKDVRDPIRLFLSDVHHNVKHLVDAEKMLEQRAIDSSVGTMRQEDALLSIEVLHAVQRMRNTLAQYNFVIAPNRQAKLSISGVDISVRADLLLHGQARGVEQIGAAVLRMTKDDATTPSAKEKRRQLGLYVATLVRLHVDQNIKSNRKPVNKLCMSIDIQHGEVFVAPAQTARRISDIENACKIIAAFWKTA